MTEEIFWSVNHMSTNLPPRTHTDEVCHTVAHVRVTNHKSLGVRRLGANSNSAVVLRLGDIDHLAKRRFVPKLRTLLPRGTLCLGTYKDDGMKNQYFPSTNDSGDAD